ncbi:MAG: nucleotidyltransferase family protein, partial [Mycobacteriales bacterium]
MTIAGVVLGAGTGTRLRPLTDRAPKPLLPVLSRPLIGHVLKAVELAGAKEIYVNLHHRADALAAYLDTWPGAVALRHTVEPYLSGPAGALTTFADRLRDAELIVVSSGDVVFADDLRGLVDTHRGTAAALTFAVKRAVRARNYGVLDVDGDGRLVSAQEKPDVPDSEEHWISCGIYCVDAAVINDVVVLHKEVGVVDFARDLAPALLARGAVVS